MQSTKSPTDSPAKRWFLTGGAIGLPLLVGGIIYLRATPDEPGPKEEHPVDKKEVAGRVQDTQLAPVEGKPSMGDRLEAEFALATPDGDDWDTEKFHLAAKDQLKKLAKLIAHPEDLDPNKLGELFVEDCTTRPLRPDKLENLYESGQFTVRRADQLDDSAESKGHGGISSELKMLSQRLEGKGVVRSKFKIYRVEQKEERVETMVFLNNYGREGETSVQHNATWRIVWTAPVDGSAPKIIHLAPIAFEEVTGRMASGRALMDCTESIAGASGAYGEQLLSGASYWSRQLSQRLGGEPGGYHGLALGDVNGDALDDVFVCQTGGLPNRLFVQQDDGSLVDRSSDAGVDFLDLTRSALFADLDNDGDQDLVLGLRRELLILENDGAGRFSRSGLLFSPGAPYSLSAADYDNDGDLDLYVCNYGNVWAGIGEFNHHVPIPMQDARNGSPNVLLQNDGGLQFVNVVDQVGLDDNNNRWSLSAAWEDFDNDGDQDLYVANDFGRNNLYRNDEGPLPGERRFVDVAGELAVEDLSPGMSANWGDCNNDGFMDLYISNMFSGAGNRITFQDRFMPDADSSIRQQFQRHARGNTLLLNRNGMSAFEDATSSAGVGVGRWAWSSTFVDLNNDTLSDILVANGYVTETETTDL